MSTSSIKEQEALAQVMRADEEEAHRAFWWRLLPTTDRARALGLARIDPARAVHELDTFTIQERAVIHGAVMSHITRMEIIMHCTGIALERRPVVDVSGALTRQAELEQQQDSTRRRRQEFARLEQEQEQEQLQRGRLH